MLRRTPNPPLNAYESSLPSAIMSRSKGMPSPLWRGLPEISADRRCHQPLVTWVPARASCRMKPSIGSNSPSHGAFTIKPARIGIAGLPAGLDAGRAEVDVLRVVFAVDRWRQQPHDMHAGEAAIFCQILDFIALRSVSGMRFDQFGDDMAQPVQSASAA